jgi:SOS-response transcriptional repressor LexA
MSTVLMSPRIALDPGVWFNVSDIEGAEKLGVVLRAQVDKYRGSPKEIDQGGLALEIGIHQGTLSKIQNDKSPGTIYRLRPDQIYTLLSGYRLSDEEIYQVATKFKLPMTVEFAIRMQKGFAPIPQAQPILGKLVRVRHLGEVNAGLRSHGAYGDEMERREVLADYLDGSNPENCFLLDVTGHSMTCEDIRKSIPAGSTLIVDPTLRPEHGDPVVCELEVAGERRGVVKTFRPTGRGIVLDSYNQEHSPILLTDEMECVIRGVVVNWIPPGRKALRRHFARS